MIFLFWSIYHNGFVLLFSPKNILTFVMRLILISLQNHPKPSWIHLILWARPLIFTHAGDSHDGCGWAEEPRWTVQPLVEARLLFHNRPSIGRSLLGFGSSDQTGPASERDATAGQLHRETWAPGPDTPCNFLSSSDKMLFLHLCFC